MIYYTVGVYIVDWETFELQKFCVKNNTNILKKIQTQVYTMNIPTVNI